MGAPSTRTWLAAICCAVLAASLSLADEVVLKNGGAIRGRIVSEDERQVVIETDAGKVTIQRARIKEVMRSQPQPPARDDEPAAAGRPTLLVFGFQGADARLVESVAGRLRAALDVKVELLTEQPAPDEQGAFDRRAQQLPELARRLNLDPAGSPEAVEERIRAALAGAPPAQAQPVRAIVDEICRVRLNVARLEAQAAAVAGARLRAPGVVGVIAVTHRDLATPELNFVFGHGDRAVRAGVTSYLRFAGEGVRGDALAHRLAVQALSTTGVLLGLGRCEDASCARAFPKNLEEHDRKQERFCDACRARVDAALGR